MSDRTFAEGFVEELRAVERNRQGSTTLEDIGRHGRDFQLTIAVINRAGDLAARGWVGRTNHRHGSADEWIDSCIGFNFDLDKKLLPSIRADIETLAL